MLLNFFKTFFRRARAKWVLTLIDLLGLSVGFCTLLLVGIYVNFELNFDRFYTELAQYNRLVLSKDLRSNSSRDYGALPYELATLLKEQNPQVLDITRLKASTLPRVISTGRAKEKLFNEEHFAYVDTNYFDFFDIKLKSGSLEAFRQNQWAVILSETAAEKYFGRVDVVGQVLDLKKEDQLLEVVGVMPDYPVNSTFRFEVLASLEAENSMPGVAERNKNPLFFGFQSFVKMRASDSGASVFAERLKTFSKEYLHDTYPNRLLRLQPLMQMHLDSGTEEPFYASPADKQLMLWASVVAAIVMIFGLVNHGNLMMATSMNRVKEIGVRKVLGADRKRIILQFLVESVLMSLMALILALLMLEFSLPLVKSFVARQLVVFPVLGINFYLLSFIVALMAGLLGGVYPALAVSLVKNELFHRGSALHFSKQRFSTLLIGMQFMITTVLIAVAMYMNRQIDFVASWDMGYNAENTLIIRKLSVGEQRMALIREKIAKRADVLATGLSDFMPNSRHMMVSNNRAVFAPAGEKKEFLQLGVDAGFIRLYDIPLVDDKGQPVETVFSDQSNFALFNESAVAEFELDMDQVISFPSTIRSQEDFSVSGVVRDFHIGSLHNPMSPAALVPVSKSYGTRYLSIKYHEQTDIESLLAGIRQVCMDIAPEVPLLITFAEEHMESAYMEELRIRKMMSALTLLGLFLAVAGILGMTLIMTSQRVKEIGIRKILGAGLVHLFALQNRKVFAIILVSFLIALPLAYQSINWWQVDFAYRKEVSFGLFALPLLIMLAATFLTSGWLTLKTASTNPVDVLRYE